MSMEFSRQEDWGGLLFPSPWDLPNPGTEPSVPILQMDFLPSESPGKPKAILSTEQFRYLLGIFNITLWNRYL